ncbi:metallo-beta-lactamase [Lucifera butyrica]|uniref:Metallo-beta-lactamase n=1 Tax=Lucifera butyrica TaxID=1351585 RepID=A0A498RDZ9_9FIRM|nr:MBL fold metallo-hydrolase [Lucifera butyrica]VBB09215.1 metallo-beta-lactamase [Lucifera butyrica]
MTKIYNDLYQFTNYIEPINLSLHQYLLLSAEPALIHTGTIQQAEKLVPQIKELLGDKKLKYIFVSHFEADECGGLFLLVSEFPGVTTICSEVTARQLFGFGIMHNILIKKPGDKLSGKDYNFEFIGYPSEVHLWEGLLLRETNRNIFFSSDLMFQMGKYHAEVIERSWEDAVANCGIEFIPNKEMQDKLLNNLKSINPKFVATGHGVCIKL